MDCIFPSDTSAIQFLPPKSPEDFADLCSPSNASSMSMGVSNGSVTGTCLSTLPEFSFENCSDAAPRPPTVRRSGAAIPRPRNAFILFRNEFSQGRIKTSVERDHRHISRIVGHCWRRLSDTQRAVWQLKAEQEKSEHMKKYPGYKFAPKTKDSKPLKRKVKRNGEHDLRRCEMVASLLLEGKAGEELETAVKYLDNGMARDKGKVKVIPDSSSHIKCVDKEPVFRDPLLPPKEVNKPAASFFPETCSSHFSTPFSHAGGMQPLTPDPVFSQPLYYNSQTSFDCDAHCPLQYPAMTQSFGHVQPPWTDSCYQQSYGGMFWGL